MKTINDFRNEYFFLSNFYMAPVTFEGITYTNSEAAFQAQKCIDAEDRKAFSTMSPSEAKRAGRHVKLRPDWETIKVDIMTKIVESKFTQNVNLGLKLLETQDSDLEEGNTWGDRIWGTVNGNGQNLLGKILMQTRIKLKNKEI